MTLCLMTKFYSLIEFYCSTSGSKDGLDEVNSRGEEAEVKIKTVGAAVEGEEVQSMTSL